MDYFGNNPARSRSATSSCGGSPSTNDDDDDEYPEDYAPLSNLPTPPLSSAASTPPEDDFIDIDPEVLAPAIHLCRLIPSSAARTQLSPGQLAEYICRSRLSFQTLAFAACVLDSLSTQFVRSWRNSLMESQRPLQSSPASKHASRGGHVRGSWSSSTYTWKPELIAIAALQISSSFLDDVRSSPKFWAERIALGAVSARDVDATVRAILNDISYELCSIPDEDVKHMQKAMMRGMKHIDSSRKRKSRDSHNALGIIS